MLGKVGINQQVSFKALQPRDWHERGASLKNLQKLSPLTTSTSHVEPHDRPALTEQQRQERQEAAVHRDYMGCYAPRSGRTRNTDNQVKLSDDQVSFLNSIKDPKLRGQTRRQLIDATQKQQRLAARDAIRGQVANMDIGAVAGGVYHERGQYPVSDGSDVPVLKSYLDNDDSRSTKGNTPKGYMPGVISGELSEQDKLNAEMAQGLAIPRRAKTEPKTGPEDVRYDKSRFDTGYGKDYMPL